MVEKEFKIDKSLIELRPNWVDTEKYKTFSLKKRNRVLFVGRLNEQKNIPLLLESIHNTDITLDIVGDGELKDSLNKLVLKKNVKVNFLGRMSNDQMPELYNSYTVYVLCSHYEGNPKSLLEAMACGCAVVGTKVPGIKEIIRHGVNGFLVRENTEDLRSAIQRLMVDKPLRQELGLQARKQILLSNSLETALSKEYSTYMRLEKS